MTAKTVSEWYFIAVFLCAPHVWFWSLKSSHVFSHLRRSTNLVFFTSVVWTRACGWYIRTRLHIHRQSILKLMPSCRQYKISKSGDTTHIPSTHSLFAVTPKKQKYILRFTLEGFLWSLIYSLTLSANNLLRKTLKTIQIWTVYYIQIIGSAIAILYLYIYYNAVVIITYSYKVLAINVGPSEQLFKH